MARLEKFISADKVVRDQYAALSLRIAQEAPHSKTLEARLLMRSWQRHAEKLSRQSAKLLMDVCSTQSSANSRFGSSWICAAHDSLG